MASKDAAAVRPPDIPPAEIDLASLLEDLDAINAFLSHDLRSPMRFVHAFAQILADSAQDRLTKDELQNITFIKDGVRQMESMVADLLRFTRLDRRPPTRRSLDTAKLVRRIFKRVQERHTNPSATLRLKDLRPVIADSEFLAIAINELFDNAFKFAASDRPLVIEVGMPDGKASPGLYVRDNGIGFDPVHTGEVFALFRRLSNFGEYEGSGVGLALVRRIAQRHGGDAWIESQPGLGTTVSLSLDATTSPPERV
jgi:light-regulated signal transduction histidine kinase (bacteriophytochrome)